MWDKEVKDTVFTCVGVNVHGSSNRNMETRMVSYSLTIGKVRCLGDAQSSVQQRELSPKIFPG